MLSPAISKDTESLETLDFHEKFVQVIEGKAAPTKNFRHGLNPATNKKLPEVPVASQDDVDRAVVAAMAAFNAWSKVPYDQRRASVVRLADTLDEKRSQFISLLTTEQGKPVGLTSWSFHVLLLFTSGLLHCFQLLLTAFARQLKLLSKLTQLFDGCEKCLTLNYQRRLWRTTTYIQSSCDTRPLA